MSVTDSRVHYIYPKKEISLHPWPKSGRSQDKKRMMIHVRVHVMGCWECGHMTNFLKWSKTKVVALHCSFQNQLELCSKVLPLWRYEVKDFQKGCVFFVFCIFLDENNTKSHDFTTFGKLTEGATIVVPWEIYQKRKLHTLKEKLALTSVHKSSLQDWKYT